MRRGGGAVLAILGGAGGRFGRVLHGAYGTLPWAGLGRESEGFLDPFCEHPHVWGLGDALINLIFRLTVGYSCFYAGAPESGPGLVGSIIQTLFSGTPKTL